MIDYKALPSETVMARDLRVGDVFYYSFGYWEIAKIGKGHNPYYGRTVLFLHCRLLGKPQTNEVTIFDAPHEQEWTRKVLPEKEATT